MRAEISQWQIPPKLSSLLLLTFLVQTSEDSGTSRRPWSSLALHFLLCVVDIILLASSYCDLELTLGPFVAKPEA